MVVFPPTDHWHGMAIFYQGKRRQYVRLQVSGFVDICRDAGEFGSWQVWDEARRDTEYRDAFIHMLMVGFYRSHGRGEGGIRRAAFVRRGGSECMCCPNSGLE